jgi:hypothetical protein
MTKPLKEFETVAQGKMFDERSRDNKESFETILFKRNFGLQTFCVLYDKKLK